jgi:hypothetical protein
MADDFTVYAGYQGEVIVSFSRELFAPCLL